MLVMYSVLRTRSGHRVTGYLQPCFRASAWIKLELAPVGLLFCERSRPFDKAFHSLSLAIANRCTEYVTEYNRLSAFQESEL